MDDLEKKLEKFKAILALVDEDTMSAKEFVAILDALVVSLQENDKEVKEKMEGVADTVDDNFKVFSENIKNFKKLVKESIRKTREQNRDKIKSNEKSLREFLSNEIGKIYEAIQYIELTPGEKGDRGERGKIGRKPNHQWDGTKLRLENPDGTWGEWIDLRGKQGENGASYSIFGRAQSGVRIKQNGVVVAEEAFEIDLATGLTVVRTGNGVRVTSSGGGGSGITMETPTGSVNGVNVTYTVTSAPQWIVVDGITYFENFGYTRVGLTLTISTPPVSYIRSFY